MQTTILASSEEDARAELRKLSKSLPIYLVTSRAVVRTNNIQLHHFDADPVAKLATGVIAFGVYYTMPSSTRGGKNKMGPCLDVWGFININTLRSSFPAPELLLSPKIFRYQFTPVQSPIPITDLSFDMYRDMHEIGDQPMNLDQIQRALTTRLRLFSVAKKQLPSSALKAPELELLHLTTPESVWMDRFGYLILLTFLTGDSNNCRNAQKHRAYMDIWQKSEEALSRYRIAHAMIDNLDVFYEKLTGTSSRVFEIDDTILERFEEECAPDGGIEDVDEYMDCLKSFLKPGVLYYQIGFEAVADIVAKRQCVMIGGSAIITQLQLSSALISTCTIVHQQNALVRHTESRAGILDSIFKNDQVQFALREFFTVFNRWMPITGDASRSSQAVTPTQIHAQMQHMHDIKASVPDCMAELMVKGLSTEVKLHNSNRERVELTRFVLRVGGPVDVFKSMVRKKVNIIYEDREGEWKKIDREIDNLVKKHSEQGKDKGFTPFCKWIINENNSGKSLIQCPFVAEFTEQDPRLLNDQDKLKNKCLSACRRSWDKRVNFSGSSSKWFNSPDEFTKEMVATRMKLRGDEPKFNNDEDDTDANDQ